MALIKLSRDDIETFTLSAHRTISFISGNNVGTTGSAVLLYAGSPSEKRLTTPKVAGTPFNDSTLEALLADTVASANKEGAKATDIVGSMGKYMELVNSASRPGTHLKTFVVKRISPIEADYDHMFSGSALKMFSIKSLAQVSRPTSRDMSYGFTNYNSLNFFTASGIPSNTALLYPSSASSVHPSGFASGSYAVTGAWTMEFFINPRYTSDSAASAFTAGTIIHLSSSYAISLVTGSSRDHAGFPDAFKLLLQLSHSADIVPSRAQRAGYPNDLIFSSSDNSLRRGKWHHCAIRWGTNELDAGTGSFIIDGDVNATFVVPSASIMPVAFTPIGISGQTNPDILVIGNYYEGMNAGENTTSKFFSAVSKVREGTIAFNPGGGTDDVTNDMPTNFSFKHPLNAELHEIRIHDRFRTLREIRSGSITGLAEFKNVKFYLPPFFKKIAPTRWIMQTPFYEKTGSHVDPINPELMFSVGGHDISLDNFLEDIITGNRPRLLYLSSSRNTSAAAYDADTTPNGVLFDSPSHRKRNLTLLPCDNGLFSPNFMLLLTGSYVVTPESGSFLDKYTDDNGSLTLSSVSLRDMVPSASFGMATKLSSSLNGPTHQFMKRQPTQAFSRLELLGESNSSAVTFFSLSTAMYGTALTPKTVTLATQALTCSAGKIKITLHDDGFGSLYRADAISEHATWNSVGSVFYENGLVVVVAPTLPFFGRDAFSFGAKGTRSINVFRINALAPAGAINSSSNVSYNSVPMNELDDSRFVYITDIAVMDKNLNVIMRAALAQPVKKRENDSILFRIRCDI